MNPIYTLQRNFVTFLITHFNISSSLAHQATFQLNVDPHKQMFGDANSHAALLLAKELKKSPLGLADEIISHFTHEHIARLEIAGPGFINAFFNPSTFHTLCQQMSAEYTTFLTTHELKKVYNIEFVSANPTGPLHLGHGRGGIIGDVLGNILQFLGHRVIKEYYINDAGSQIQKLGISLKIRCQQLQGLSVELPEDAYHGEYLIAVASEFLAKYSEKSDYSVEDYALFAKEKLLQDIAETLHQYKINFDVWFSEASLHTNNSIAQCIQLLQEKGYLYKKDGALWFSSTQFSDDKDRVIQKESGECTYVAADIAYMKSKIERGADHIVMILGHDHHSYTIRLQAIRSALQIKQPMDIILYQLVKLKSNNQQLKMSKRAGTMITLQEVIDAVGPDVARFFYLHRKADAQLEFDVDLALKKTDENPVYYVQYAYVRTKSILAKAEQEQLVPDIQDCMYLGTEEQLLIKKIASLRDILHTISHNFQTHVLTYYIIELSDLFHQYYSQHRVIDLANLCKTRARLLLFQLLRATFEKTFKILGISLPDSM